MSRRVRVVALVPLFLWRVVVFVALLARDAVLSSLRVAWDVLTPTFYGTPGVVAMPLDARTDLEITMVANVISLTPGTLSLDVSDDRRTLWVHAMFTERDPDRMAKALKRTVERRVLRLLRTFQPAEATR